MAQLDEALTEAVARDYAQLTDETAPVVELAFHPYRGLHHTLRERDGRLLFRFSDLFAQEPSELVRVTARILIFRMLGRPVAPEDRSLYESAVTRPAFRARLRKLRRQRGRKRFDPPRGAVHDLKALFDSLNSQFFEDPVSIELLGWSRRESRRVLAHYDQTHEAIIVNRRLDNPLVPEYVVRYVLFHEMLHARLGEEQRGGRRRIHHARFRKAERAFPDYERANRFIVENLGRVD